jgi:hypothetical protein
MVERELSVVEKRLSSVLALNLREGIGWVMKVGSFRRSDTQGIDRKWEISSAILMRIDEMRMICRRLAEVGGVENWGK